MYFYISGSYNKEKLILDYAAETLCPVLASFAYPKIVEFRLEAIASRLRASGKGKLKFMIDSGAFTAWSNGAVIDINKLIECALRARDDYSDVFDFSFVALDAIPGKKGRRTTDEDRATACETSAKNYEIMFSAIGHEVKPVFHTGDPDWLVGCYRDADVVGLGMALDISEESRIGVAQSNALKFPGKKLHGLAATGWNMMRAVRWYSIDSAAWMYAASMGALNWVKPNGRLVAIPISAKSPKLKELDSHIDTLPAEFREMIAKALRDEAGLDIEEARHSGEVRQVWNARQYRKVAEAAAAGEVIKPTKGLFDA